MEEGLDVPHVSLEGLKLHAAADTQNLLDLDPTAGGGGEKQEGALVPEPSGPDVCGDATLPVLQPSRHVQELRGARGNGLDAAAEGAVLPQAGRSGAPQRHLARVQDVSD